MSNPQGQSEASAKYKWIGTRPDRPDGADKVTGRATFGADYTLPGMLVGRVKRSPHAHARIVSMDVEKAKALPGVIPTPASRISISLKAMASLNCSGMRAQR